VVGYSCLESSSKLETSRSATQMLCKFYKADTSCSTGLCIHLWAYDSGWPRFCVGGGRYSWFKFSY